MPMVPGARRANNFLLPDKSNWSIDAAAATLYALYYTQRALLNGALYPLSVCGGWSHSRRRFLNPIYDSADVIACPVSFNRRGLSAGAVGLFFCTKQKVVKNVINRMRI